MQHGRVAVHIEHPRVGVSEHADACIAQGGDCTCGADPLADAAPGAGIVVERARDDLEGDVRAPEGVRDFRYTTGRAGSQPIGGVGIGVVELRDRLQIEDQHLGVGALHDGQHLRRGCIRGGVADKQIDLRFRKKLSGSSGSLRRIDHPCPNHFCAAITELLGDDLVVRKELFAQARELAPIRFEADGKQSDTGLCQWHMLHSRLLFLRGV